jgi:hypothetical protein
MFGAEKEAIGFALNGVTYLLPRHVNPTELFEKT